MINILDAIVLKNDPKIEERALEVALIYLCLTIIIYVIPRLLYG